MAGVVSRSTPSTWRKLSTRTIPTSTTVEVDTFPFLTFHSATYIISVHSTANAKTKSFVLTVTRTGSTTATLTDSLSNKVGKMSITVLPSILGSDFRVSITNNEAFTITVNLVRSLQEEIRDGTNSI